MEPRELIHQIEAAGGVLSLNGESISYKIPVGIRPLIAQLREHKADAVRILSERQEASHALAFPELPPGIRLVRYEPKVPPVPIDSCSSVIDTTLFIRTTLQQMGIALTEPKRWVGWTVPQLIDRLAQVGVTAALESRARRKAF